MQTFLPLSNPISTAKILDYRRLGKQRVEAKQILMILLDETKSKGWRNHPAVKMWKGHESALAYYGYCMCREWKERGYKDTLTDYFKARMGDKSIFDFPKWASDPEFNKSHRSNLVRKDEKYYRVHFPDVPNNLPYIWPSSECEL